MYRTSKLANAAEKISAFWARCHESPVKHFRPKDAIFKKKLQTKYPKKIKTHALVDLKAFLMIFVVYKNNS